MKRLLPLLLLLAPSAWAATSGIVFSAAGDPLAGVRVTAHRPALPSLAEIERPALATATTGEDGSFTLDTNAAGVLAVRAERDGHVPALVYVRSGATDVTIDLPIARTMNGRVNAGGALVIASSDEGVVWTTRADEKGAFKIAEPRGWCSELTVVHPDYAPVTLAITHALPSLNITLPAGASVHGKVVDANGRPVKNARVLGGWREASSSEDGSFTLQHLSADIKRITATDGAMSGHAARSEKELTIRIEPKPAIAGIVRDAENRPIGGVTVAAWPSGGQGEALYAISDDKGHYRIEHCEAADHHVNAQTVADLEFEIKPANLRKQALAQIDFTAKAVPFLRGIVVDERKRPIAGATVTYLIPQMPPMVGVFGAGEMVSARTNADGRFRLATTELFEDETALRLQALHRRFALGVTENLDAKQRTSPITITLADGIETAGSVVDAEGNPVSGAAIVALQDPFGAVVLPVDTLLAARSVRPLVTSDAEGKFVLRLNAAPHDLGVWEEGYAGFRQGGITPKAGSELLKIVLEAGAQIRGRVTRKGSNRPVAGTIMARGDDASFGVATVADDGAFTIDSLRPGAYTLQFGTEEGGTSAEKQVKAPASDVLFELPAVGEIRGRVVDKATGRALSSFDVQAQSMGDTAVRHIENEETFTLEVGPGEAEVHIQAAGYIRETKQVSVEAGKVAELSFSLTRGRSAYGRVTADNGVPIHEARISVVTTEFGSQAAESDEDGEFRLEGLARDRVTIEVTANGFVGRKVDVEAGELDARVDVALSRGRKATGRVITSAGAPVENADVWAYADARHQVKTRADGTFVIEGLEEDRYSFYASREDLGSAEAENADISREVVITIEPITAWGAIHGKVKGFVEGGWMYGFVMPERGHANGGGAIGRDGTYRIEKLPAGETELRAMAMSMRGNASTSPVKVTVVANEDIEVDLAFRTDVTIRGTVLDGGEPAVGRRVTFNSDASTWSATVGDGGAYEITAIEPGSYDVSVNGAVDASRAFSTSYQVTGSATFDIRIERAEVRGRVVDEQGMPLQGAKIAVTHEVTNDTAGETLTGADGAFRVPVFRAAHVVTATKSGFATATQRVEGDAIPVVLKMTRSDGLRVRLTDARNGATLDGYVVATDSSGLHVARLHEAQNDRTILVPLAAGTYRISASADGFATQSVQVAMPRSQELRIALTPGGTLIVNAGADTASDVVKLVLPNGEEYVRCECNGIAAIRLTGAVTTIEHVAPGRYTLQVLDTQGLVKASYPVTIEEGKTTTAGIHVPE